MEGEASKLEQISGIFSRFSEENKDRLLETAKRLLKAQGQDAASVAASRNGKEAEGRRPKKLQA